MTGYVHSIQTLGTLDGPGVRCVVFLQGCPLRCRYCHNPDTWQLKAGALMTVDEVLHRILRCKPFFGSDGGVTISGGEALIQAEFAAALFKKCKENGVHTALDTSGCVQNKETERLLDCCDLCLLDVKALSESAYQDLCGGSFAQTMAFLAQLEKKGVKTWIRQVIVPGLNDTAQHVLKLKTLLAPFSCVEKTELLPFYTLCKEKYKTLGIPFPLVGTPQMEQDALQKLQALL